VNTALSVSRINISQRKLTVRCALDEKMEAQNMRHFQHEVQCVRDATSLITETHEDNIKIEKIWRQGLDWI
jgi:hypothetical protein